MQKTRDRHTPLGLLDSEPLHMELPSTCTLYVQNHSLVHNNMTTTHNPSCEHATGHHAGLALNGAKIIATFAIGIAT